MLYFLFNNKVINERKIKKEVINNPIFPGNLYDNVKFPFLPDITSNFFLTSTIL